MRLSGEGGSSQLDCRRRRIASAACSKREIRRVSGSQRTRRETIFVTEMHDHTHTVKTHGDTEIQPTQARRRQRINNPS